MAPQAIYLVRHGETEWASLGKHTGLTDIPLTAKGKTQAKALKDRLSLIKFDHVWTSPLKRASETCKLAGYKDPIVSDLLCEWNYGKYEGKTIGEIQAHHAGWHLFYNGAPDGEAVADVAKRADALLEKVMPLDGNVLLFSHGHFLRALTSRYLGLPLREGRLFALNVASISCLSREHDRPVILHWNT